MKKFLAVFCLLWFCWVVQPASVSAALETLPLPTGSDILGPIDPLDDTKNLTTKTTKGKKSKKKKWKGKKKWKSKKKRKK